MNLSIVSIGPGDPQLMNLKTTDTIRQADVLILRTGHHPLASWLEQQKIPYRTMDILYEEAVDFESLSHSIAGFLWKTAEKAERTVYAVSDMITDHTVDAVFSLKPDNGMITVIPGFSFADYYLPSCRELICNKEITICSASSFISSQYDPSKPILITELNDGITAGEVKNILSGFVHDDETVLFLDGNAFPKSIPLFELDRQENYDHLSAVAAGSFSYKSRSVKTINDLMNIMNVLRSPSGCPWDRKQTHDSLKPFVVEEAWEVVDAISQNDPGHLSEELGDLLFQVVFHASIGESFDEFSLNDVIESICEKMIRRHPHVFCKKKKKNNDLSGIQENWDRIKQEETGSKTPAEALLDVSPSLPSLRYAEKILRKLERMDHFTYPTDDELTAVIQQITMKLNQTHHIKETKEMLGTLLLLSSELARRLDLDTEVILHEKVKRVIQNAESVENEGKKGLNAPKPLTFNDLGVY